MDDITEPMNTPVNTPLGGEFKNEDDDEPRVDMDEIKKQMGILGAQMHNRGYEAGVEEGVVMGLVAGVVGAVGLGIMAYMCYRQLSKESPAE